MVGKALFTSACLAPALLLCSKASFGQLSSEQPLERARLFCDAATRIADPKLDGGGVELLLRLEPTGSSCPATLEILEGSNVVATPWSGTLDGGTTTTIQWDGRGLGGSWLNPGSYTLRIHGPAFRQLELPLQLVRLGIREMEFQDSPAGNDEFPMVYFRKAGTYTFFATPEIHEYLNTEEVGEISDLDLNNGDPRPSVPVHAATDEPVMEGANYDDDRYNYPLAYVLASTPRVEVTFGTTACSEAGLFLDPGYPVAGFEIRVQALLGNQVVASSGDIQPGGTAILDLLPLQALVGRVDQTIEWRWQYRENAAADWSAVPGSSATTHRFYTLLGEPNFKSDASGTQYAGPWVEVCEYEAVWSETLGIAPVDVATLTQTHVRGFFGQNGGIPTALEGVIYDAYPLGGDGGASHYFSFSTWRINLSGWLNQHDSGIYVNCSDNMGASSTMLAMLGVDNVRPMRLGPMTLKAIWGIGAPEYTTNLWGNGHGFSYHHIVTDDAAITVSDTCMQLDEDGNPGATPGIPGWNHHRPWLGTDGYRTLSAYNNVTYSLEALPGLR